MQQQAGRKPERRQFSPGASCRNTGGGSVRGRTLPVQLTEAEIISCINPPTPTQHDSTQPGGNQESCDVDGWIKGAVRQTETSGMSQEASDEGSVQFCLVLIRQIRLSH